MAYLIVPLLFLGPLYAAFLEAALPLQKNWDFPSRLSSWEGFRNYIMVRRIPTSSMQYLTFIKAPVTEEITYRACVLSLLQLSKCSRAVMIWVAPCWFGLAHIHHAYETYKRLGRTTGALRTAMLSSRKYKVVLKGVQDNDLRPTVFQFIYTTVFGWLCSFLFLRTGSIFVPISAHVFCNIMGFPMLPQELKEYPNRRIRMLHEFSVVQSN